MFFELRQYPIKPGKRDELVKLMDEVIIPFQVSKGMIVHGAFVDEANDTYIWMRRFESEEEKDALYDAAYNNDFWLNGMKAKIGELIERDGIVVQIMRATPRSLIQ